MTPAKVKSAVESRVKGVGVNTEIMIANFFSGLIPTNIVDPEGYTYFISGRYGTKYGTRDYTLYRMKYNIDGLNKPEILQTSLHISGSGTDTSSYQGIIKLDASRPIVGLYSTIMYLVFSSSTFQVMFGWNPIKKLPFLYELNYSSSSAFNINTYNIAKCVYFSSYIRAIKWDGTYSDWSSTYSIPTSYMYVDIMTTNATTEIVVTDNSQNKYTAQINENGSLTIQHDVSTVVKSVSAIFSYDNSIVYCIAISSDDKINIYRITSSGLVFIHTLEANKTSFSFLGFTKDYFVYTYNDKINVVSKTNLNQKRSIALYLWNTSYTYVWAYRSNLFNGLWLDDLTHPILSSTVYYSSTNIDGLLTATNMEASSYKQLSYWAGICEMRSKILFD